MNDLSGQTVKGYELHEMIGAGGFGAVYRAYQPLIKRDVAMKIILPEFANHPEFIRRFEFEAQLVARLEHIHIVPLYDYWREPDGAFLIMRWLRGGSLRSHLKEGPLPIETVVHIVDQIGSALGSAHRRGVVHRDIKPDNILFDDEGNAVLADFGIAKDLRAAAYGETDTIDEGALTGSPFYLAPEQAQSRAITPQTDLYSLGIVIYEMLVGQPPFAGDQGLMAILLHHINDPVPSVLAKRPDLPREVDVVVQRATAKDPASRYLDANSMATDFRRALVASPKTVEGGPLVIDNSAPLDEVLIITKPISASTLIIVPTAEIVNPYKGLQPFEEADAEDFFGREMLIEKLLERLQEPGDINRFLAVIGPSGSGKSSVVKAGMIPALRRGALPNSDRWYVAEMIPSTDPFRELASALLGVAVDPPENLIERLRSDENALVDLVGEILPPGDKTELLLFIDQFEEVFTLLEDEAARAHFLNVLLMAIAQPESRIRIIITLRADFYDRPLLYPGFGEMVRRRNDVVLPLVADEMREAIIGPAERVGMTVESGLVAAIVAEIAAQPGALPLMQYALTEVFERREGTVLTLKAYHESGGVLGALARRAEELFQQTPEAGQEAMRQVFLRLVTLGEGTDDTRRRAMQHELMGLVEDENVVNDVINALGRYRLLTFDHDPDTRAPTVAVAHEALIREWKRLRSWLDESREDILLQRRLATANEEWSKLNRDASFLASGARLQQFESLAARGTIALTPDELDYVRASVQRREAIEAEERARAEREAALEKRSRQRLRALVIGASIAAVITTILALLALVARQDAVSQRKNADRQRTIAERSAVVSDSLALSASAQTELVSHNNDLAIALSLQANQITDPPVESQRILAQTAFSPGARRVFTGHDTYVFGVAYSPDGTMAVSGDYNATLFLWDVKTGEIIRKYGPDNPDTPEVEGHSSFIRTVAYSPDGKTFLSGAMDSSLILWDVETGAILRQFGPDNPDTPEIEGHAKPVRGAAISPDGTQALSASDDYTAILWDLQTGAIIHQFGPDNPDTPEVEGHAERVRGAAISPDGKYGLTGSYDTTIILWDLQSGDLVRIYTGHEDKVATVAFSPDGKTFLSGSADRTLRQWDVESGAELLRLQGHGTWVKSVAYSPDGRQALSASDDSTVRLWNLETGDEMLRFTGHTDFVEQAVFSPDGYQVLSASGDGTLRLWDLTNGAEVRRYRGHTQGVLSLAISPDGKTALTGSFDTTVRIWDVATGQQISEFDKHSAFVDPLIFNPDGTLAVSADASGTDPESATDDPVWMWDIATGEIVKQFVGHKDWVLSAAFSPDGASLVTGAKDNTAIVWNVDTAEAVLTLVRTDADPNADQWVNAVAYSPDGSQIATGTQDNLIILYDAATGAEIRRLEGHDSSVNSLQYSNDGQMILSASDDTTIRLWTVATGDTIRTLQGHTASVQGALFSPDNTLISSISYDGTIRLWDAATGAELRELNNVAAVWALAYTPDGQTLMTGSEDSTVRLWDATPLSIERLIDWIHANRYVLDLTCQQREKYRVTPLCDAQG